MFFYFQMTVSYLAKKTTEVSNSISTQPENSIVQVCGRKN